LSREEGITVIHITHSLEDVLKSERVLTLNEGSIIFDGSPCDILENMQVMDVLGWSGSGLARFIKTLIAKRLLSCEGGYSPENVAESIARYYDGGK
jgi:energy-coupling factor transport system ATP-binding protein